MTVNCGVKSWKQQRSSRGKLHADDDDDEEDVSHLRRFAFLGLAEVCLAVSSTNVSLSATLSILAIHAVKQQKSHKVTVPHPWQYRANHVITALMETNAMPA